MYLDHGLSHEKSHLLHAIHSAVMTKRFNDDLQRSQQQQWTTFTETTLQQTNIAMENPPFEDEDVFPIGKGGFSIAMLVYRSVRLKTDWWLPKGKSDLLPPQHPPKLQAANFFIWRTGWISEPSIVPDDSWCFSLAFSATRHQVL